MTTAILIPTTAQSLTACVPADWTDEQVIAFAGDRWRIFREPGEPDREPCRGRTGHVHLVLEATT